MISGLGHMCVFSSVLACVQVLFMHSIWIVHCFWQVAAAGGGGRRAGGVALDSRTVLSSNTFTFNTSGLAGVSWC